MEYLASQTGDEISRYLSQYSAEESWIPEDKAKSVNLTPDKLRKEPGNIADWLRGWVGERSGPLI
jgi:hypothetical protein